MGAGGSGLRQFLHSYLDDLLTYGNAVGEMVPFCEGEGIAALYNVPLENILIRQGENPLDVKLFANSRMGEAVDSYHSRPLEGIEQLEPLSEQEIETLLGDGVTVLEMADGQAECIRCVTTRTRTGNEEDRTFSSVNVVMMIDEIIRAVRERLSEVLDEKKQQGLITSFEPPVAYVQKEDPSVCVVELEFDLAAVFSRIYLTAHISI